MPALALLLPLLAPPPGLALSVADGHRTLQLAGRSLLEVHSPWIATGDWKPVRHFPLGTRPSTTDEGAYGRWTETITEAAGELTIRYEFDFQPLAAAAHLQWFWSLPPALFDGAMAEAVGKRPVAMRPVAGMSVKPLKEITFVLPEADLTVRVSSSDGEWSFADGRQWAWAKCYRLQYDRDYDLQGKRSGWLEVKLTARAAAAALVPLAQGQPVAVRGLSLPVGPLVEKVERKLAAVVMWHTVTAGAPRGSIVGEVSVSYADGTTATVPFRAEQEVTAPDDDPRDLPDGTLANGPDGRPAWLTAWRNPRPDVAVTALTAKSLAAGWRVVGAVGVPAEAGERRVQASLAALRGAPLAEEVVVPLDGTWRFQPAGRAETGIAVPAMWDRVKGFGGVNEATYKRTFDVPAASSGQRIALHFGAVGDSAQVFVNGNEAGRFCNPTLPNEVDITGLVNAPSQGNTLEVRVADDTHTSVPRESSDWRDRRTWVPRGIGAHNRKGLIQSVTLRGRPAVQIGDVRVQTSVREHKLTVVYELSNSRRETVQTTLSATVRPTVGGAAVVTLPAQKVELPGYVRTTVTLTAPFGEGVELWQPDHPALYTLRSLLADDKGQRLERRDTRFGFREVWFAGPNFYLNGIRCNLRGESPCYGEKTEMFATREAAAEMIGKFQRVNFNVLRFHALPVPPHVLDVCDELGMLVIDESAIYASWQMLMPEHPEFGDRCRAHLTNWVRRDRNHPAVVLWSGDNEGLNVSALSPAQLAAFARTINAEDGTRPVTFDGDGSGLGASPAVNKHYVYQVSDLQDEGGRSSGYGHDLRADIYWATAYQQTKPLGCGEFLFPYEPALRAKEKECIAAMGLQTRGYRLANWYDIRPYNPSYCGFLRPEGLKPGYEEVYDLIAKSFAPVAVFDKDYDALGPFPAPPRLKVGQPARRTLIVYNDEFADEQVTLSWQATAGGQRLAGDEKVLKIPLGEHVQVDISFTPAAAGEVELVLRASKGGKVRYEDRRGFVAEP